MTRLENIKQAGYYPIPPSVNQCLGTYLAAPDGGRLLDPCAGEGRALVQMARQLGLEPYGVELNRERAKAAQERIKLHLLSQTRQEPGRHLLADGFAMLRASKGGFNLIHCNPPYLAADDKDDGRTEYVWLRDSRPSLQPGGVLLFIVPQHILKHTKTIRYLASWYGQVRVFRFPDGEYERFKQVVIMGVRRQRAVAPDPEQLTRYRELAGAGAALTPLTAAEEPAYVLPPLRVATAAFRFGSAFVEPREAAAEAQKQGVMASAAFRDHFRPQAAQYKLAPLTPLKIGHLVDVIAGGHLNNHVLDNGTGKRLLIKGQSYKAVVTDEAREDHPEGAGYTVRTTATEVPVTNITSLSPDGDVQRYEGPALQAFLERWMEQLTQTVAHNYPPRYTFDLGGYGPTLNRLNRGRKIPLVGKPGLLPAQKHAAAAAATALTQHDAAFVVGEMGTGKTIVAAATVAAARSQGMRAEHTLVLCPPHLTKKWKREIEVVWPEATAVILKTRSDVDRFFALPGPAMGILKETTARAGSGWHHSYQQLRPVAQKPRRGRQTMAFLTPDPTEAAEPFAQLITRFADTALAQQAQQYLAIRCPTCGEPISERGLPIHHADFKSRQRHCPACGHALYQDGRRSSGRRAEAEAPTGFRAYARYERALRSGSPTPRRPGNDGYARTPLATYIKKRYKHKLDVLVADECHEYKSADSDRGYAFHRLATAASKTLCLTGTIYGGKASSLFYLLYRTSGQFRRAFTDGSQRGQGRMMLKAFLARYGILQEIETVRYDANGAQSGNTRSRKRVKELPGASPALLPWLLNRSVFLSLRDMGLALPAYEERPIEVPMTAAMAERYHDFRRQLLAEMRLRLVRGDKSLLGAYLQALLTWPDAPWRAKAVRDRQDQLVARIEPLPAGVRYPKERAIIDAIRKRKKQGRRVLLLCQQTASLDITPQWTRMLEEQDLKVAVLKSSVSTGRREEWVQTQVDKGVDVLITHPRCVQTGLDLLHFPTIIWMGTEYSVYTVLQASRRSWRIGQDEDVEVLFYVYRDTLQEEALRLVAAKVAAALRVNGDTIPEASIADLDDITGSDIVTRLAQILVDQADREEKMKDVNEAWEQYKKGERDHELVQTYFGHCEDQAAAKKRYRQLARKYHPDSQPEDEGNKVESLADAFAKANEEIRAGDSLIGGYEMEDEAEAASEEPATPAPTVQGSTNGQTRDVATVAADNDDRKDEGQKDEGREGEGRESGREDGPEGEARRLRRYLPQDPGQRQMFLDLVEAMLVTLATEGDPDKARRRVLIGRYTASKARRREWYEMLDRELGQCQGWQQLDSEVRLAQIEAFADKAKRLVSLQLIRDNRLLNGRGLPADHIHTRFRRLKQRLELEPAEAEDASHTPRLVFGRQPPVKRRRRRRPQAAAATQLALFD